ncbi:unnamed protein product [Gongylonema pulchrum]|uniref:SAP domain-containing protein n=1 Tax=Gongylonema pulchrum TaxID=637853 RepID=A0A183D497_9BILA|nr:unnamed protein product [Gongylonema pulchrum]
MSIPRSIRTLEENRESCSINTPDLHYLMERLGLRTTAKSDLAYEVRKIHFYKTNYVQNFDTYFYSTR